MDVLYSNPNRHEVLHYKSRIMVDKKRCRNRRVSEGGGGQPHTFIYIRHLSFALSWKIKVIPQKSAVKYKNINQYHVFLSSSISIFLSSSISLSLSLSLSLSKNGISEISAKYYSNINMICQYRYVLRVDKPPI